MNYKTEHETFVSGGTGSTQFHIAVTVIASIIPLHLRDVLYVLFPKKMPGKDATVHRYLQDFVLFVVPLQLIMTTLNEQSPICLAIEALIILILCNTSSAGDGKNKTARKTPTTVSTSTGNIPMGNHRPFINYYRGFVLMLTAFSILAVDFKIFPRYFAKAETYGTGLMDVGVGCFMISNAIVSPEARGKVSTDKIVSSVLKSVRSSVPLLVLGAARVGAVKWADYQEHVTEYGTHWNFFFTLAAVKVMMTLIVCLVPDKCWNMAGVGIIAVYQHSLRYDGLADYLIKGADGKGGRGDLLDANREGIYSCAGYLSLYIMAVQLGKLLMKKREKVSEWIKLCIHLVLVTVAASAMLYYCEKHVEPVSRRFANLPYMLWMLAFNSVIVLVILIFDIILTCLHYRRNSPPNTESHGSGDAVAQESPYGTSPLMNAVTYNGLAYFLLANLLTGLVNMTVRTIYQPSTIAMAILTLYMLTLSSTFTFLYHKRISLKVW